MCVCTCTCALHKNMDYTVKNKGIKKRMYLVFKSQYSTNMHTRTLGLVFGKPYRPYVLCCRYQATLLNLFTFALV